MRRGSSRRPTAAAASRIDATYFDNRLHDAITTVYDANFVGHPVNLPGSTRQRGVEVAGAARLPGGWRLDASYTYLDAPQSQAVTLDPDHRNDRHLHRPGGAATRQNIASANLTYAPADAPYSATVTVRYNGPQKDLFFGDYPPLLVDLQVVHAGQPQCGVPGRPSTSSCSAASRTCSIRRYQEVYSFADGRARGGTAASGCASVNGRRP